MSEQIYSATTFTRGKRTAQSVDSSNYYRNVAKESLLVEPFQTPLVQWLHLNKNVEQMTVTHPLGLYEGMERELLPTGIPYTGGSSSGASATVTVSSNLANLFYVGQRVKIGGVNQTGRISGVSGTTITITRDLNVANAGQNWSAINAENTLQLIGTAWGDKTSPSTSVFADPFFLSSRCQIFGTRLEMTDRLRAAAKANGLYGGDWWTTRLEDMMKEVKIVKEKAFWENENHHVVTAGDESTTVTQGIVWTILNYGGVLGTYAGSLPTEPEWDAWLYSCKRGSAKKTVFVGDMVMRGIEVFMKERLEMNSAVSRYSVIEGTDTVKVMEYRAFNLLVEIIWNPLFEGDMAYKAVMLDDKNVAHLNYAPDDKGSRQMRIEPIVPTDGAPIKAVQLIDDTGVYLKRPATCGVFQPG